MTTPALPSGILLSFPDLLLSFAYRTDLDVYLIISLPQILCIILIVWEHHVGELRYLHPRFRLTDYPCEVCISIYTFRTRYQDRSFTATWAVVVIVPSAHTATHTLSSFSVSVIYFVNPFPQRYETNPHEPVQMIWLRTESASHNAMNNDASVATARMLLMNVFSMSLCFLLGVVDDIACFGYLPGA